MQIRARARRPWTWLRGRPTWMLDAGIATVFVIGGFLSTSQRIYADVAYEPRDGWAYALILAATLPYYVRRRAPLPVFLASTVAVAVLSLQDYAPGALPLFALFGAYTVGAHRPLTEAVTAAAAAAVLLLVLFVGDSENFGVAALVSNLGIFAAAILLGWNVQSRRLRLEALERGHLEAARAAAADERLRIAQELHDVVAHSLGVIAVQAGVGAHMLDQDVEEARKALDNISTTSRSSLAEIRRLLGVVRERDDAAEYAPAPGLADLPRLVRDMGEVGLDAELIVDGDLGELPSGVELAAYRIIQEALTNALRHAHARHVTVRVTPGPGEVGIVVTDDGRGGAPDPASTGHGLVGMRERAAHYGGTVEAGPLPEGGWRVATCLRYDTEPAR
ncbi:sensor histidine kinase [Actinomarinicola tropica]|uniref:histidine kinase n=1 Tax=Actinomarinicola tropica TaxID=2789776 RepID=A0A5Q2RHN6_9ACTN|nr:sensor histidine kinase [Actinomarinicola tropica]QGG94392.1 sensor histidine kinase [Actinomarinicola tropica]